jgi:hypothetical protein
MKPYLEKSRSWKSSKLLANVYVSSVPEGQCAISTSMTTAKVRICARDLKCVRHITSKGTWFVPDEAYAMECRRAFGLDKRQSQLRRQVWA